MKSPAPAAESRLPPPFDQDGALGADFDADQMPGAIDPGFENADRIPDPPPIPQPLIRNNPRPQPKSKKGVLGWIVFLLLIGGIGAGGYFAKDMLIGMWPPIAKIYDMVGLDVPHVGEGLDIRELPPTREEEDGVDVLVVRAEIVNIGEIDRELPYLLIELLDPLDRVVQRKKVPLVYGDHAMAAPAGEGHGETGGEGNGEHAPAAEHAPADAPMEKSMDHAMEKQILPVGESMQVETRIRRPNPTATRLQVTFLDPREAIEP